MEKNSFVQGSEQTKNQCIPQSILDSNLDFVPGRHVFSHQSLSFSNSLNPLGPQNKVISAALQRLLTEVKLVCDAAL